jgi:dipeptidyl aminopeptidase/acylaminoacyl peptidase
MASTLTETGTLTPDRILFDIKSIGSPRISSDGRRITYIFSETERGTAMGRSHLWLMESDGTNQRQITQGGSSTSEPAWSPDDAAIAFVSNRGKGHAICVLPIDGGEARLLTAHARKPVGLEWSPDCSKITYTVEVDPENPDEADRDPGLPPAVRAIRRIDYKQDNRGYLNDVRHQVMVVDVESGERRQVSTDLKDHAYPQWSPDGLKLAAKISLRNGMNSILGVYDVESGDRTTIGWEDGGIGTWRWSRDGSFILFNGSETSSPHSEFFRYDVATGETRQLTSDLPFSPESGRPTISGPSQPVWLDDATALVHGTSAGASGLWTVNAETGEITEVARWDATHAGLSVDASGTTIVQGQNDTTGSGRLVRVDRNTGETTVLLDPNADLFAEAPSAQVEKITVTRDGWDIDAWVHKPADFDENGSYPIILDVHGGPHGNHGFTFNAGAQILASHGYIVIAPNPRGSGTYGKAFGEAVHGDWGGEDWLDLLAVLDTVLENPWADAGRVHDIVGDRPDRPLQGRRLRRAGVQPGVVLWHQRHWPCLRRQPVGQLPARAKGRRVHGGALAVEAHPQGSHADPDRPWRGGRPLPDRPGRGDVRRTAQGRRRDRIRPLPGRLAHDAPQRPGPAPHRLLQPYSRLVREAHRIDNERAGRCAGPFPCAPVRVRPIRSAHDVLRHCRGPAHYRPRVGRHAPHATHDRLRPTGDNRSPACPTEMIRSRKTRHVRRAPDNVRYTRARCVSLNPSGYFRPYPSIRSNPICASQTSATCVATSTSATTPTIPSARASAVVWARL